MTRFKPGTMLSLVVAIAFAILVALGTWQARKIAPKNEQINRIRTGLSAVPAPLPVHINDPAPLEYRRFSFEAIVSDQPPVKIFGTDLRGRSGYHLYQPVRHIYGRWVMVNWGWIPAYQKELPPLPQPGERLRIDGVLRLNAKAGSFSPANDPKRGDWYVADIFELAAHYGLDEFYHFRIAAEHRGESGELPIGGQVRIDIPNDHFEYMLTWYGLAVGLLGVFGFFGVRRGQEQGE